MVRLYVSLLVVALVAGPAMANKRYSNLEAREPGGFGIGMLAGRLGGLGRFRGHNHFHIGTRVLRRKGSRPVQPLLSDSSQPQQLGPVQPPLSRRELDDIFVARGEYYDHLDERDDSADLD